MCSSDLEEEEEKEKKENSNSSSSSITLEQLQSRLNHLYQLLANPQIINLHGFEQLLLKSVSHDIKQRVNTLFFEAHIPSNWKIKTNWSHPSEKQIVVHITLLNYIVKERVKEMLLNYFENNYNRVLYVD